MFGCPAVVLLLVLGSGCPRHLGVEGYAGCCCGGSTPFLAQEKTRGRSPTVSAQPSNVDTTYTRIWTPHLEATTGLVTRTTLVASEKITHHVGRFHLFLNSKQKRTRSGSLISFSCCLGMLSAKVKDYFGKLSSDSV